MYSSVLELTTVPREIQRTPHLKSDGFDYETYWATRGRSSIQPRHRIIAEVVGERCSVLEIGCGDGFLMEFLAKTKKSICLGYDISEESLRLARERGVDAKVADVMSEKFSVGSVYDYVVVCELSEHLDNPEKLISKLRDLFTKALIVSIPNIAYFKHRLRLLCGRFPVQWGWHPSEHLRYWSLQDNSPPWHFYCSVLCV